MGRQTRFGGRQIRLLGLSMLLWLYVLGIVWVAQDFPLVSYGDAAARHPAAAIAAFLAPVAGCHFIGRALYAKRERRFANWLPLAGLWGAPMLLGIVLSLQALNGLLDDSAPDRHACVLVAKRTLVGRGWFSRGLEVSDRCHEGRTLTLGGPSASRAYDALEPGQSLHVTTRRGLFDVEWVLRVEP